MLTCTLKEMPCMMPINLRYKRGFGFFLVGAWRDGSEIKALAANPGVPIFISRTHGLKDKNIFFKLSCKLYTCAMVYANIS